MTEQNKQDSQADSLIEYPCAFPLKIMGLVHEELSATVLTIVTRHDPDFDVTTVEYRNSTGGKYVSLTCTVTATSRRQLDAIYMDLTSHPLIKVVL